MRHVFLAFLIALLCINPIVEPGNLSAQTPEQIRILEVTWNPQGDFIAQVFDTGNVLVIEATTGQPVFTFDETVRIGGASAAWNPVHPDILAAGICSNVYIWNVTSGQLLMTLEAGVPDGVAMTEAGTFTEGIVNVAWDATGNKLASLSIGGLFGIWDTHTGEKELALELYQANGLTWNSTGTGLLYGGGVTVRTIDASSGQIDTLGRREDWLGGVITSLALSKNGNILASSSGAGEIVFWDTATKEKLLYLHASDDLQPVTQVAWHPDNVRLASASSDSTVRVWDAVTGRELLSVRDTGRILSLAWSPDGSKLAYGGETGTLEIVDFETETIPDFESLSACWVCDWN